jgi:hypothetical protein
MICDVLQPIRDCICMRKSTAASCSLGFCKYDPPVRTKIESVKLTVDLRVAVEGQGLLTGRQDMGSLEPCVAYLLVADSKTDDHSKILQDFGLADMI